MPEFIEKTVKIQIIQYILGTRGVEVRWGFGFRSDRPNPERHF